MRFEDLQAWQQAREVVNGIYRLCREPILRRDLGLVSQIQRASVSAMSNIAEGFERIHPAEKVQAYNIARASCGEVRSLLYVVEDNFPELANHAANLRESAASVGKLTSGLMASTRSRMVSKSRTGN